MAFSPPADAANPYQSPGAASDARGKLGWLIMLVILWPLVMGLTGLIIGFFVGRLRIASFPPEAWNPGTVAVVCGLVFASAGVVIGIRKARNLRGRLDDIHARREELRQEVERRMTNPPSESAADE